MEPEELIFADAKGEDDSAFLVGIVCRDHEQQIRYVSRKELATAAKRANRKRAVVETKERVPGPVSPEPTPSSGPTDLRPGDVVLAHASDVSALRKIFHVPIGADSPEAFFDAVARDACSTTKNLDVSSTALWEARVVYRRLADDDLIHEKVLLDVEAARRIRHEVAFERLFILACADLFATVLSTPIALDVPPELDERWKRVSREMKSEGLIRGLDEIEWRETILNGRLFDLELDVFMQSIDPKDEPE